MPLNTGTRLGPYEIQASIGAGGMGEVYRARDTRLDRIVALKVISPLVAASPDLHDRFEREARTVSQLNHPHICTLHDVGRAEGVDYLVLEYLDGESLAERLNAGPLPLEHATTIAMQICDALDKAHRAGIVHRDLKPGNVFLVRGSSASAPPTAKLLDFGLAKVLPAAAAGSSVNLTSPPTVTTPLTTHGTILGTFQYMAPEQLEGIEADERTDIWAFGCVLYEMLTGRKAFAGRTHASLISSIMSARPAPVAESLPQAPPVLDHVIGTCLAKDPAERFQTAHDLLLQLRWMAGGSQVSAAAPQMPARRGVPPWMFGGAITVVALLAAGVTWLATRGDEAARPLVTRATVNLPADRPYGLFAAPNLAISPDGSRIIYAAFEEQSATLFARPLDRFEQPSRLSGAGEALMPFFSPDGAWVAFFSGGKLKKIPSSGGAAMTICDMPAPMGAAWGADDTIVFSDPAKAVLMRVPASGGTPQPATSLEAGEVSHRWPSFLPDGGIVFSANLGGNWSDARIVVQPADGSARKTLTLAGSAPLYVDSGHLVFVRAGALYVVPFDAKRKEVTGPQRPVAESVAFVEADGRANYAVSRTGVLAYVTSPSTVVKRELLWVARDGKTEPIDIEGRAFDHPRISPDGRFVAMTVREANPDIWLLDIARRTLSRFTVEPGEEESAVWTPDGRKLAYAASPAGKPRTTFMKAPDNSSPEELVHVARAHQHLAGWTPDGKTLVVEESDGSFGIFIAAPGDKESKPYLQTRFTEVAAHLSPDGRWIAYTSNEAGRAEVYVQSFPTPGHKVQISTEGGGEARWARNGRELFYRHADRMMAVSIEADGSTLRAGSPRLLFQGRFSRVGWGQANYDVAPDGKRFLMIKGEEETMPTEVHLVVNWFDELRR